MTNYDATSGAGRLQLDVELHQEHAAQNYSTYRTRLRLFCNNGLSRNADPTGWEIKIHGWAWSGTYTFDFRNTNEKVITDWLLFDVVHNPDGTSPQIGGYGYSAWPNVAAIPGSMQAVINPNIVGPRYPRGPKVETSPGNWQQSIARVETSPGVWQFAIVRVETSPGNWQIAN